MKKLLLVAVVLVMASGIEASDKDKEAAKRYAATAAKGFFEQAKPYVWRLVQVTAVVAAGNLCGEGAFKLVTSIVNQESKSSTGVAGLSFSVSSTSDKMKDWQKIPLFKYTTRGNALNRTSASLGAWATVNALDRFKVRSLLRLQ